MDPSPIIVIIIITDNRIHMVPSLSSRLQADVRYKRAD